MRPSKYWTDESGSASVEFVTAGLLLLVPLVYLVLAMATIQAGALAGEGAARQAARVFVQSASDSAGRDAVARAVEFALADHGVASADVDVEVSCAPVPTECHTRHGLVTVTVRLAVPLPLAPPVLGADTPLAVPLEASATQQVSRFRSDE